MRALLGAAGSMAAVVLRDLLEFAPDVEVTAADRRPIEPGDSRVTSVSVDVRDEEATARLVSGHDVVLNCVTSRHDAALFVIPSDSGDQP
jgi:saccharopine dehydrogenase-like NADP-dependent oxidoreductase